MTNPGVELQSFDKRQAGDRDESASISRGSYLHFGMILLCTRVRLCTSHGFLSLDLDARASQPCRGRRYRATPISCATAERSVLRSSLLLHWPQPNVAGLPAGKREGTQRVEDAERREHTNVPLLEHGPPTSTGNRKGTLQELLLNAFGYFLNFRKNYCKY